jgi:hypothetical protein
MGWSLTPWGRTKMFGGLLLLLSIAVVVAAALCIVILPLPVTSDGGMGWSLTPWGRTKMVGCLLLLLQLLLLMSTYGTAAAVHLHHLHQIPPTVQIVSLILLPVWCC